MFAEKEYAPSKIKCKGHTSDGVAHEFEVEGDVVVKVGEAMQAFLYDKEMPISVIVDSAERIESLSEGYVETESDSIYGGIRHYKVVDVSSQNNPLNRCYSGVDSLYGVVSIIIAIFYFIAGIAVRDIVSYSLENIAMLFVWISGIISTGLCLAISLHLKNQEKVVFIQSEILELLKQKMG